MTFISNTYINCVVCYFNQKPIFNKNVNINAKIQNLANDVLKKADHIKDSLTHLQESYQIKLTAESAYAFYAEISDLNCFNKLPTITIIETAIDLEKKLMIDLISWIKIKNRHRSDQEIISMCLFFGSQGIKEVACDSKKCHRVIEKTCVLKEFEESLKVNYRDRFVEKNLFNLSRSRKIIQKNIDAKYSNDDIKYILAQKLISKFGI